MKTLQEQINEQIEFCERIANENPNVNSISIQIRDAEVGDIELAESQYKMFSAGIDTVKDRVRLHLRNGDWCIFVYSVPVKITTSVKYEAL